MSFYCEDCEERGEAAERDAERYRWLVRRNPLMVASIAYSEPGACQYSDVNEAVDAAMAAAVTVSGNE